MGRIFAAFVVVASITAGLAGAVSAAPADPGNARTYVVVLRDGADAGAASRRDTDHHGVRTHAIYRSALNGYTASMTATEAAAVSNEPDVAFIEPSHTFKAPKTPPVPTPCTTPATCQIAVRAVRRIDADLSSTVSGDGKGKVPVNVAIIDSGVDASHPDLNVVGGTNCFDDGVGVGVDTEGHGTIIGGVIGAKDNHSYVVGVAPSARLWSVRSLDENLEADDAQILCGIEWVAATRTDRDPRNDIQVANMSLGGEGADDGHCGRVNHDAIHLAICRATALGVTFVAAAGNDAVDLHQFIPAAYREVLTATGINDEDGEPGGLSPDAACGGGDDIPASFSNFGARPIDASHLVAASAVCVSSVYPGNDVAVDSGTSYAAPSVTGTVALCIANGPCKGRTPSWIVSRIVSDALRYSGRNRSYGFQGDPFHPIAGRYYGPLIRAGSY